MARGLTNISGQRYYFSIDTGERINGLIQLGSGYYIYILKNGGFKTGIQRINEEVYFFNALTGVSMTGCKR